ncbi:MAG: hypothetical protein QMD85_00035 [Candidatus Aenigmarchaeota archaeon]|nr:hypothetical protein [Candidatus Aenigmarchaeota archaeon]MDI6721917.1 hypothetical protein [Candidatus Aenigmarchaeota archaeon]
MIIFILPAAKRAVDERGIIPPDFYAVERPVFSYCRKSFHNFINAFFRDIGLHKELRRENLTYEEIGKRLGVVSATAWNHVNKSKNEESK